MYITGSLRYTGLVEAIESYGFDRVAMKMTTIIPTIPPLVAITTQAAIANK